MADIDPLLQEILSDENRLNQVLELASMLSSQRGGASPAPRPEPPARQAPAHQPLSSMDILTAVAGSAAMPRHEPVAEPVQSPAPSAQPTQSGGLSAILAVLPQLLQAISGTGSALAPEKVNLVQAIRPYAPDYDESFERALRVANVAKVAKDTLSTLSSRASEADSGPEQA